MSKGAKWYGWDSERAETEWDNAVRDVSIPRRIDEYGELCIAKLRTHSHKEGNRISDIRAVGEQKDFNAGDVEAIRDARDGQTLNMSVKLYNAWLLCFLCSVT